MLLGDWPAPDASSENAEIDVMCDQGRFYGTENAIGSSTDQST
jgi:hypothetical protein